MKFRNPSNGYTEESNACWLWCLLFGIFYLAFKGAWMHCLLALFLAFATGGLSWFIYPFFASTIVRTAYLKKGWVEVSNAVVMT